MAPYVGTGISLHCSRTPGDAITGNGIGFSGTFCIGGINESGFGFIHCDCLAAAVIG